MLAKREAMEEKEVLFKSGVVTEKFIKEFGDFDSFLLYTSFKNEVRTFSIISYLQEQGKNVFLPKLVNEDIFPSKFEGFENMEKNRYGIMEPMTLTEEKKFDIVVMPAVAFDKKCNRLGFGKGYYDRLLSGIICNKRVGFAYNLQIVDHMEVEPHDIPADVVITEEKNYRRN